MKKILTFIASIAFLSFTGCSVEEEEIPASPLKSRWQKEAISIPAPGGGSGGYGGGTGGSGGEPKDEEDQGNPDNIYDLDYLYSNGYKKELSASSSCSIISTYDGDLFFDPSGYCYGNVYSGIEKKTFSTLGNSFSIEMQPYFISAPHDYQIVTGGVEFGDSYGEQLFVGFYGRDEVFIETPNNYKSFYLSKPFIEEFELILKYSDGNLYVYEKRDSQKFLGTISDNLSYKINYIAYGLNTDSYFGMERLVIY